MTPIELLTEVKNRFAMLLHDDDQKLEALLKQAIGKYQDLAGFMSRKRFELEDLNGGSAVAIERIITRVVVKDKNGRFIQSEMWNGELELSIKGFEVFPITVTYFEDMRSSDLQVQQLPESSISLIADYLELLIAFPNSERQRRIAIAGKLDASDIPTEESLSSRKVELEERIKSSRAILPTISLF